MIMDESGSDYHRVSYGGSLAGYICSCPTWQYNQAIGDPSWCNHIKAVSGSKVSVKQRKYGHIVRMR
jgi:predicted nucleic acid-binding Zn finger protein